MGIKNQVRADVGMNNVFPSGVAVSKWEDVPTFDASTKCREIAFPYFKMKQEIVNGGLGMPSSHVEYYFWTDTGTMQALVKAVNALGYRVLYRSQDGLDGIYRMDTHGWLNHHEISRGDIINWVGPSSEDLISEKEFCAILLASTLKRSPALDKFFDWYRKWGQKLD